MGCHVTSNITDPFLTPFKEFIARNLLIHTELPRERGRRNAAETRHVKHGPDKSGKLEQVTLTGASLQWSFF